MMIYLFYEDYEVAMMIYLLNVFQYEVTGFHKDFEVAMMIEVFVGCFCLLLDILK